MYANAAGNYEQQLRTSRFELPTRPSYEELSWKVAAANHGEVGRRYVHESKKKKKQDNGLVTSSPFCK
ncbi:hypothetical protein Y032_0020g213 [Ancylostoma ceylanicum]|uniref:Uncharacterized protein n=1 Tax=Ancylostoma ceylanicum TaxID=53326 RepID=A0A016V0B3_9BILA|nr:hypothetical protein Y032_0020g213 [Ancylostoma ceylanicum]